MARADILLAWASPIHRTSQGPCLVQTPAEVLYTVFADQNSNICWAKSSDGGFSWTDPVLIKGLGGASSGFSIWYDKWTPGHTGTRIHFAYFEQTGDDVFYNYLDTSGDTLGTEVSVFAGASSAAATNTCISITRAIGGNIYIAFDIDAGTETGFYRSTDSGATFASRTNVNEAVSDYYYLAPGFAADTQDILCIFWDRSADELSRKIYDDSANSWAETSIAGTMVDLASSSQAPNFSIAVDDANNKILLAAWSASDTANADLRVWAIDESAITEKTNVVLNSTDDQTMCAIGLATDTSTIYVFYGGKSDGSETAGTSIHIYYKTSADGGTNWGSETQLSQALRNYDYLGTVPNFIGDFVACFQSQTSNLDSLLLSVLLPSGAGGGLATNVFSGSVIQ